MIECKPAEGKRGERGKTSHSTGNRRLWQYSEGQNPGRLMCPGVIQAWLYQPVLVIDPEERQTTADRRQVEGEGYGGVVAVRLV